MVGRPHELMPEDLADLEASLPSTAFVPYSGDGVSGLGAGDPPLGVHESAGRADERYLARRSCRSRAETTAPPSGRSRSATVRLAAKDKVALERLRTAARRRGTTPPPTSSCRPPHPYPHGDSGEEAIDGRTGNAAGRIEQSVRRARRDDARDEQDRR